MLLQKATPRVIGFGDGDVVHVHSVQSKGCGQSNGPATNDQRVTLLRGVQRFKRQSHRMPADRQRFGQCGLVEGDILGHGDKVSLGHRNQLCKGPLARRH